MDLQALENQFRRPFYLSEDKGVYGGVCNRSACPSRPAYYFNFGSGRYYCKRCALTINGPEGSQGICLPEVVVTGDPDTEVYEPMRLIERCKVTLPPDTYRIFPYSTIISGLTGINLTVFDMEISRLGSWLAGDPKGWVSMLALGSMMDAISSTLHAYFQKYPLLEDVDTRITEAQTFAESLTPISGWEQKQLCVDNWTRFVSDVHGNRFPIPVHLFQKIKQASE